MFVSENAIFWLPPEDTERESMETEPSECRLWECLGLLLAETDASTVLWLRFLNIPSCSTADGDSR